MTFCSKLRHKGRVADISTLCWVLFLPCGSDVQHVKPNLVVLVSHLLLQYFKDLSPLSKSVPQHIDHQYTEQMSRKSKVVVLDVLMKNEARSSNMVDITQTLQGYIGDDYPSIRRVSSGGD